MDSRRSSDKNEFVNVSSFYRRGSEKYDYLSSRGSISQVVISTDESNIKKLKNYRLKIND